MPTRAYCHGRSRWADMKTREHLVGVGACCQTGAGARRHHATKQPRQVELAAAGDAGADWDAASEWLEEKAITKAAAPNNATLVIRIFES